MLGGSEDKLKFELQRVSCLNLILVVSSHSSMYKDSLNESPDEKEL